MARAFQGRANTLLMRRAAALLRGAVPRNSAHLPSSPEAWTMAEFPCAPVRRRRNPAVGTGFRAGSGPANPRIFAHFPSNIYGNLSNNPVNLSEFIYIYGNDYLHFACSPLRLIDGPAPAIRAPSTP